MEFKNQPYQSKQCGQTCLAMITGKKVGDVCKELDEYWSTNISKDLQPYLNRNGYKTRLVLSNDITFEEVPNSSIIRVCYISGNAHFIVKHEDRYYDPIVGIIEKPIGHFRITEYLSY